MKSLITGLITLLFVYFSTAQIEFDPDVILLESDGIDDNASVIVKITNTGLEPVSIHWMFEKGEGFPEEWDITIADDNIDYVPNYFKNAPSLPNYIAVNDSIDYWIRIIPNNTAGSTYCIVHLYDDAECENEVAASNPPTTSVYSVASENLLLYPNPTNDYFSIKNDDKVKSIDVINSIGQIVMSIPHEKNEEHSISNLPSGMFAVVLKDSENEILRSLYLFKK